MEFADQINARAFASRRARATYAALAERGLTECERICLSHVPEDRRDSVLDIGVGAGRTAPGLARAFRCYRGIDYSGALIEEARTRFPDLAFGVADARSLDENETFDCVVFSYNGIDYLPYEDRRGVQEAVFRALKPGGYFFFSTHNAGFHRAKPALEHVFIKELFTPWPDIAGIVRRVARFRRQYADPAGRYLLLNNLGLGFRLMHVYVDVAVERDVLRAIGFEVLATIGERRREPGYDAGDPAVHIVSRKPLAA